MGGGVEAGGGGVEAGGVCVEAGGGGVEKNWSATGPQLYIGPDRSIKKP